MTSIPVHASAVKRSAIVKNKKTVRGQKPERLRIDDPQQKTLKTARISGI
jgi:hypothetical protein